MKRTTRPGLNVHDPWDWSEVLEALRSRAVDIEAVAHAAAERDPPASDDPNTRRQIRRLCSLVEVTHAGIVSLVEGIDDILGRAMRLGDEMTEVQQEGPDAPDPDATPIPT